MAFRWGGLAAVNFLHKAFKVGVNKPGDLQLVLVVLERYCVVFLGGYLDSSEWTLVDTFAIEEVVVENALGRKL